jgi:hypothetical protein
VLTASGIRLIEAPGYQLLVPIILVVGAAAAVLTQLRRMHARAVAEA